MEEFRSPPRGVRVFQKIDPNAKRLAQTEFIIREDELVMVDTPELLDYDHREQLAARVTSHGDSTYYVLMSELCPTTLPS